MLNQFNLDMVGTLRVPSIKQCRPFGCQKNCPLEWGFPPKIQTTPTVLAFWRALNTWFIAQTNDIPFCSLLSLFCWCLLFFLVLFCFSTIVFKFSRNCKPARVTGWVAYKINYYSHDLPVMLSLEWNQSLLTGQHRDEVWPGEMSWETGERVR